MINNLKTNYGLTFVQILIAIVILSITVIPVASVFFTSNRNVERSGTLLEAAIILQSVIDTIKDDKFIFENKGKTITFPSQNLHQIIINDEFLKKYNASGTIKIDEADGHNDPNLVELNVSLNWIENGIKRETSITTYVANLNDVKFIKIEQ